MDLLCSRDLNPEQCRFVSFLFAAGDVGPTFQGLGGWEEVSHGGTWKHF